jgi:hypothetical protein
LLPALALFALALAGCGSGGGNDDRTASIIHRILQAAGTEGSGPLESFPGRLPEGLPAEPPRYPDSDIIVSSRVPAATGPATPDASGEIPQPMLYFIVLDAGDDRTKVFSFYEQALEVEPWQLESTISSELVDSLEFSNVDDADLSGVVSVSRGGRDGRTTILISLQDAGAFREEPAAYAPGESLPLPKELPPDLPLYDGAIITSSAFLREPANESFLVIFVTRDSQDDVIAFYREEFQKRDWTVLAGEPFGLEERIDFRDAAGDIQGELIADRFPRDDRYTEVRIQFQQDPRREPATGGEATPAPTNGATPEPTED